VDARGGGGEVGGAGRLAAPREVGSAKLEAGSEVGEVVAVDLVGRCGGRSGEVAGVEGRRSGGKSRSSSRAETGGRSGAAASGGGYRARRRSLPRRRPDLQGKSPLQLSFSENLHGALQLALIPLY